jgi:hypothetical protein
MKDRIWVSVQLQGSFVVFWLVYLVTLSIGIILAYLIAIISPNMDVANAALPTYVVSHILPHMRRLMCDVCVPFSCTLIISMIWRISRQLIIQCA